MEENHKRIIYGKKGLYTFDKTFSYIDVLVNSEVHPNKQKITNAQQLLQKVYRSCCYQRTKESKLVFEINKSNLLNKL